MLACQLGDQASILVGKVNSVVLGSAVDGAVRSFACMMDLCDVVSVVKKTLH